MLSRILIEIFQPREEKLKGRLKAALGFVPGKRIPEKTARTHYIRVKRTYLVFYLLILTMALTGLGLAFEDNPLLKAWQGNIRQIHSFVQYLIYGFILIHLVGVIWTDGNRQNGLVSGMIHGKKQL